MSESTYVSVWCERGHSYGYNVPAGASVEDPGCDECSARGLVQVRFHTAVPEPQPIHERYAEKVFAAMRFAVDAGTLAKVQGVLREMVEEVRREEQDNQYIKADPFCSGTGKNWDEELAREVVRWSWFDAATGIETPIAAMEGGSPTYTQGVDAGAEFQGPETYRFAVKCFTHGVYLAGSDGFGRYVDAGCPKCKVIDAAEPAATYRCPRHGTAPAFSKTPFTEADVPYGCPSCGSRLEKV